MIKYEADKHKNKIELASQGTLNDLLNDSLMLISLIYERIKTEDPGDCDYFKKIVRAAINDDTSPIWLNTYEKEMEEND